MSRISFNQTLWTLVGLQLEQSRAASLLIRNCLGSRTPVTPLVEEGHTESYHQLVEYYIAAFALIVFAILALIGRAALSSGHDTSHQKPQEASLGSQIDLSPPSDSYAEEDQAFEAALHSVIGPHMTRHFYTKVVGITFKNPEGIIGEMLTERCKPCEFLQLVPEPDNPFDSNAIAVHLKDGSHIGYLDRRTAGEISRDIKKGGHWLACVKLAKPKTATRHGCLVLCLVRVDGEFIEAGDELVLPSLSLVGPDKRPSPSSWSQGFR